MVGVSEEDFVANLLLNVRICQWKHFENRSTFGEVMGKAIVDCFLT